MKEYTCSDSYIIRKVGLPIKYLLAFENQSDVDVYNFIKNDDYLDDYFRKALFFSSKSLYNSYINPPDSQKKYKNLNLGLLKFLVRATTRTTPYGYFSKVGIAPFFDDKILQEDAEILDVFVEREWITTLVNKLETKLLKSLQYKMNNNAYISGDRYKIPHVKSSKESISEVDIRNTAAIKLIVNYSKDFIDYGSLEKVLLDTYPKVSKEKIEELIMTLLKNNVIYSNLRLPTYCRDSLSYIYKCLISIGYRGEEIASLKKIQELIQMYKNNEDVAILEMVTLEMERLANCENYLCLNRGVLSNKCSRILKTDILKLVEFSCRIPVRLTTISSVKRRFLEKFGRNVEVPFSKIIDKNDFNALKYLEDEKLVDSEYESSVSKILDSKISKAIFEGKEVLLEQKDFEGVYVDTEINKGFDLAFLISNNKVYLSPMVATYKAGAVAQRFSGCFPEQLLNKYNELYSKEQEVFSDYILVELREYKGDRSGNVINNARNYDYTLSIGTMCNNYEIPLCDLLVGIDNEDIMYVKSKKFQKRLKFIFNNVLNIKEYSGVIQLLKGISDDGTYYPEARLSLIKSYDKYKYIPKIKFNDIIISNAKWMFDNIDLKSSSYDEFKDIFLEQKKVYKIPNIVYITNYDNRLRVNLTKKYYLEILYKEFKKASLLNLEEVEEEILLGNKELVEGIFPIFVESDFKKSRGIEYSSVYTERNRSFRLFKNGWIYFKLYGCENREDEIITKYLSKIRELNRNLFFIRYEDETGRHLRIRVKFENEEAAIQNISDLLKIIDELKENKLIEDVIFDTYVREINRYGGLEVIEDCENFFFENSNLVELMLIEGGDTEFLYFLGILSILENFVKDRVELLTLLKRRIHENIDVKKDYREKRKEIDGKIKSILKGECNLSEELCESLHIQNNVLKIINSKIRNSEDKVNIIFSLVHMFCNRLTGDNTLEEKNLAVICYSMEHILESAKRR